MNKVPFFYRAAMLVMATGLIACFLFSRYSRPKVGYVMIQEVFADFELKKELQKKLELVKTSRQKITDSLRIELVVLSKKTQSSTAGNDDAGLFEKKRAEYAHKVNLFEEDNTLLIKQYDTEIITQLNQYVKDYGTQHGYDMIYGNNADGSLMFGNEAYNITGEVKAFINARYKGIN